VFVWMLELDSLENDVSRDEDGTKDCLPWFVNIKRIENTLFVTRMLSCLW
jgi:hypothetical protein